jgi:hypothetical protein
MAGCGKSEKVPATRHLFFFLTPSSFQGAEFHGFVGELNVPQRPVLSTQVP